MDTIKPLVDESQLKSNFLSSIGESIPLNLHYDDLSDTLMLLFVSPYIETIVHYLDRNVAILYREDDLEIVGLQIEGFQKEFIPKYTKLQKIWCLSDFGINDKNIWDLSIEVRERNLKVALEIIRVKENIIGRSAKAFEKVLEKADMYA